MSDNNIEKKCSNCVDSFVSMWSAPCNDCDNFSRWRPDNIKKACVNCVASVDATWCGLASCTNYSRWKPANIKKSCEDCENHCCDICDNYSRWQSNKEEDKPIDTGTATSSPHYNKLVLQPVEMNQLCLSKEQFIGFLKGNIIKYSMRCGLKDEVEKEQNKIRQYKKWLDEALDGKIINPRESD